MIAPFFAAATAAAMVLNGRAAVPIPPAAAAMSTNEVQAGIVRVRATLTACGNARGTGPSPQLSPASGTRINDAASSADLTEIPRTIVPPKLDLVVCEALPLRQFDRPQVDLGRPLDAIQVDGRVRGKRSLRKERRLGRGLERIWIV